jgi:hypothetical protein
MHGALITLFYKKLREKLRAFKKKNLSDKSVKSDEDKDNSLELGTESHT